MKALFYLRERKKQLYSAERPIGAAMWHVDREYDTYMVSR